MKNFNGVKLYLMLPTLNIKLDDNRLKDLSKLENTLFYHFKNIHLLNQALIHSSYANESTEKIEDNEKLEFLGDAVLNLAVTHLIIKLFPEISEGEMSKIKSSCVNETALADISKKLKIGEYLLFGKGEKNDFGKDKNSILADTWEAIIGAIYLDSNFDNVLSIVEIYFTEIIKSIHAKTLYVDFKSELQEYVQKVFKESPKYILKKIEGPPHNKIFEVESIIQGKTYGKGVGKSKKIAEQEAAKNALNNILILSEHDRFSNNK